MRKSNFQERRQVNENIRFPTVRLIGEDGQLGVYNTKEAIQIAEKQGRDVVIINAKSSPPIAKLLDANKYFYEQHRREKEAAKKQRENQIVIKEMQFRLGIGDNDFDTKIKSIEKFLSKGNKVKCVIRYKGRENANKQQGFWIMDRITESLENVQWDSKPSLNGNRLIGVLMRKE
jgi:translation initiation factor IF-3